MLKIIVLLAGLTLAASLAIGAPDDDDSDREIGVVVRRIAGPAKLRVEVDRAIASRITHVDLEGLAPLAALRRIASAANVHLVEIDKNTYWLGPKLEAWELAARKGLVTTRLKLELDETPLPDALGTLAKATGFAFVIDPHVFAERDDSELEINLRIHGIRARDGLELATQCLGLAWDLRWGVVFVSTGERLEALPGYGMSPPPTGDRPEWETKMRTKLATERASISFAATPLPKALKLFCTAKGLELTTEGTIPTDSVGFTVSNLTLRQILDLMLVPRGCTYDVTKKGVIVKGTK